MRKLRLIIALLILGSFSVFACNGGNDSSSSKKSSKSSKKKGLGEDGKLSADLSSDATKKKTEKVKNDVGDIGMAPVENENTKALALDPATVKKIETPVETGKAWDVKKTAKSGGDAKALGYWKKDSSPATTTATTTATDATVK